METEKLQQPLVTRAEVRLYLVALAVFVIGMAVAL